jgi:flap endonuclease-1
MGIKGLNKVIRKLAPHIIREKHIGNYVNSRIAIDSSILIYKYRYGKAAYGETGLYKDSDNSHVLGFIQKACFYLRRGIVPVFVFDGKPPNEKQNILDKRSNQKIKIQEKIESLRSLLNSPLRGYHTSSIGDTDPSILGDDTIIEKLNKLNKQVIYVTKQHKHDCKYLLRLLGVPVIEAYGEAEATCAELQKKNLVQFTFTEDSDALTFGSPVVIRGAKKNETVIEISLCEVLSELKLTYDNFIDFCILCGCDYTTTIPKLGPLTSLHLVQEHKTIENILNTLPDKYKIPTDFNFEIARELFKQQITLPPDFNLSIGEIQHENIEKFLINERKIERTQFHFLINKYKNSLEEFKKINSNGWKFAQSAN